MKKLELKDICFYLPYGLKFEVFQNSNHIGIEEATGADSRYYKCKRKYEFVIWCNGTGYDHNWFQFKPILRPLSDLYKTITHNGKEIIPIVELAKIAEPNYDWKINSKMAKREIINETWTDKVFFGYTGLHRYFKSTKRDDRYFYSVYQYDNIEYIPDQTPLFDYLHELKIDYRGLIDAKLCISCYDLPENPYK